MKYWDPGLSTFYLPCPSKDISLPHIILQKDILIWKREDGPDLWLKDSSFKEGLMATLHQCKYICEIALIFVI